MKGTGKPGLKGYSLIFLLILAYSCTPLNQLNYFNDINEIDNPDANPREQKVIMPFDKIYIKVLSTDDKTASILNFSDNQQNSMPSGLVGYLVDENGKINYPFAGEISVGGQTLAQASVTMQKALSSLISNSAIIVKFIDSQITVLGEVQHQGVFPISQDKINIYDAIALGGGLTRYGNHKKVILIRQENNKPIHYKLDLSTSKIASAKLYYVIPNDVIIVEPTRGISWNTQNGTFLTILSTLTSIFTMYYIIHTSVPAK
jgi:polysaccharide biosynthesis/export protein